MIKMKFIIILIFLVLIIAPGFYNELTITNYKLEVQKIKNPIRIALVSDLHSCKYKEEQYELIDALNSQSPDLVMLVGDIFDDVIEDYNAEKFLEGISNKYPIYYVTGNHEYWSGEEKFENKMRILEKYGVKRLQSSSDTILINGEKIIIYGVDDPDSQNPKSKDTTYFQNEIKILSSEIPKNEFTILLSHRPEFFDLYNQFEFDLVLSGHAHGGQWRIPGILNGIYAPNQGFFPKYSGGKYEDKTTMIVSRGLSRESTRIPRFYNPPELVIIDLI